MLLLLLLLLLSLVLSSLSLTTTCLPSRSAGSTRYSRPVPCGRTWCSFGASCSADNLGRRSCVCAVDCRNPLYYREAVCGSDGNTYRSECQLRQYSCRLQKEVVITQFSPCKGERRTLNQS